MGDFLLTIVAVILAECLLLAARGAVIIYLRFGPIGLPGKGAKSDQ